MMDEIWLVRHAESTANAGEPTLDYATIPLSTLGWLQAKSFVARVPRPPERIVVSPYIRSRQTAEPLIARHFKSQVQELPVQEFSYLHFKGDQPLTWLERVPRVEAYWNQLDPWHREGGHGESYADLVERVAQFLGIAATWRGFSVVFSHEQFIRAVAISVLTRGLSATPESMRIFVAWRTGWRVPNVGVLRLQNRGGQWWVGGIETQA